MDVDAVAEGIVAAVGGPGNIHSVGHCTTRLRMVLADRGLADRDAVRALPGITATVERGGQFQVIVGHEVGAVDARVRALVEADGHVPGEAPPPVPAVDRAFDFFMGTFQPLLWALVGASMVRTMLSLAVRFDWIDTASGTYAVWAAAGSAVFILLPVFVGITASAKLGANPYVGGAIGAALVAGPLVELGEPGTDTSFLGLPLRLADYSSSAFPAMLAAIGLAVLERWLRRVLPKDLHLVAIPALCLAILVPATALLFGPIGTTVSEAIASAVTTLNGISPVLTGAIYAAGFMFMVMLGLHWATLPAILAGLAADGSDPLVAYMGAANFAVFGVAFGVAVRTRDPALRQLGSSGVITGLLAGISEPTLYGILLRFKRTLPIMVGAAALGGALLGLGRVESTAFGFSNIFTIPAMTPTGAYVIGIGVAFALAAMLVILLGYEGPRSGRTDHTSVAAGGAAAPDNQPGADPVRPTATAATAPTAPGPTGSASVADGVDGGLRVSAATEVPRGGTIRAPLPGLVVPLDQVPDPVFARGLLGSGVAIRPTSGLVRAPAPGVVTSIARAKHAIGITTDTGVDLVIHLGIDTVHLAGRLFDTLVTQGQRVATGDPLILVDLDALRDEGYDTTTPVVVTNAAAFGSVETIASGQVTRDDELLRIIVT